MSSNIKEIIKILKKLENDECQTFFKEVFTEIELKTLSKRWQILKMLKNDITQREIAKELNVSLCKVTRGSRILKEKNSITAKYLPKEIKYDNK